MSTNKNPNANKFIGSGSPTAMNSSSKWVGEPDYIKGHHRDVSSFQPKLVLDLVHNYQTAQLQLVITIIRRITIIATINCHLGMILR